MIHGVFQALLLPSPQNYVGITFPIRALLLSRITGYRMSLTKSNYLNLSQTSPSCVFDRLAFMGCCPSRHQIHFWLSGCCFVLRIPMFYGRLLRPTTVSKIPPKMSNLLTSACDSYRWKMSEGFWWHSLSQQPSLLHEHIYCQAFQGISKKECRCLLETSLPTSRLWNQVIWELGTEIRFLTRQVVHFSAFWNLKTTPI